MVLNVSLDHLKEEEVELILRVLERDAKIQEQEDQRKRRLQDSIRGERVPEKRLSIKLRTGEWMEEMTTPTRIKKKRGTEIVRASIRRKSSKKKEDSQEQNKAEKVLGEKVVPNGQIDLPKSDTVVEESPKEDGAKLKAKGPLRKTSIRRKKVSQSGDKQVKFATDETKKFVYEQTTVDSNDDAQADVATKDIPAKEDRSAVPTIVVHEEMQTPVKNEIINVDQPVEVTVITDDIPVVEKKSYDNAVFSSNATFESYHNAVGKEMPKNETVEDKVAEEREEKSDKSKKVLKKVKIKRIGSSRRKDRGNKITDDSSRDTLFNAPEESAKTNAEEPVKEAIVDKVMDIKNQIAEREAELAVEEAMKLALGEEKDSGQSDVTEFELIAKEIEKKEEDDVISNIVDEVVIDKMIEEEVIKPAVKGYEDAPNPNLDDGYQHKMDAENIFEQMPRSVDVDVVNEEDLKNELHELGFSPKPDLDLGFGDVLEQFGSRSVDVTQPVVVIEEPVEVVKNCANVQTEIAAVVEDNLPVENEVEYSFPEKTLDGLDKVEEVEIPAAVIKDVAVKVDDIPPVVLTSTEIDDVVELNVGEKMDEKPVNETPEEIAKVVEAVSEDIINTTPVVEQPLDSTFDDKTNEKVEEPEQKPKKKVVKKVVKKKKKEDKEEAEEKSSPKAEPVAEKDENAEGSPVNNSRLQRAKTVRRKVVKKAPPKE